MGVENIKRVVVLMLENRSFDHMLGDLSGVDGASTSHVNVDASGTVYAQTRRNNLVLPLNLDPKHEFPERAGAAGPGRRCGRASPDVGLRGRCAGHGVQDGRICGRDAASPAGRGAVGDGLFRGWRVAGAARPGQAVCRVRPVVRIGAGAHLAQPLLRHDGLVPRPAADAHGAPGRHRDRAVDRGPLLVILHDEHGGFYDHVAPEPTQSADDAPSHPAFDYATTGVRVPCVLVSPWIQRGVLSDVYDHTSLLAFLCGQFQLTHQRALLGRRTASAGHFGTSLIWSDEKRSDVPALLPMSPIAQQLGEEASADLGEMLPKLLSGLIAHAQAMARPAVAQARSTSVHAAAAAASDLQIAQAWEQGGTLAEDDVRRMVAAVKETFAH